MIELAICLAIVGFVFAHRVREARIQEKRRRRMEYRRRRNDIKLFGVQS